MDPFALIVLEWIGKAIVQKVLGKALTTVWERLAPKLELLIKSADEAEQIANAHANVAAKIADDAINMTDLLNAANKKIEALQAENATLRERLTALEMAD